MAGHVPELVKDLTCAFLTCRDLAEVTQASDATSHFTDAELQTRIAAELAKAEARAKLVRWCCEARWSGCVGDFLG